MDMMIDTPQYGRSPSIRSSLRTLRMAYNSGRSAGRYVKQLFPKSKPRNYSGVIQNPNPINAQAGRASMKRKYNKNEKLKSTKKVKVSKGLREKVKKVIAGENAYGSYNVRYGGMIGYIDPGASAVINRTFAYGRDGSYVGTQWGGTTFPAGSKVWFAAHCANFALGAATAVSTAADRAFAYFTPLKILDAASVLWNQKTAASDPTIVTNNFSLATATATGTPQLGSSQFPVTGPLEIRIINSYVTWRMKNTSQRSVLVKIYHCVPKLKYADVAPLTILQNTSETVDTATVLKTMNALPLNAGGTPSSTLMCHPMFEPNQNTNFASVYKYSLKVINLKPGEECVHSIQGPKNYTMDYSKFQSEGETKVGSFFKHTTVMPIVSVEVDSVFAKNAVYEGLTGQYAQKTANANGSIVNPISIEVDEVFKLSCPQNTGFISRGTAAGAVQTNNLKTSRQVYVNWNFTPQTADTYTVYNEENIAAGVVESNTA